MSRRWQQQRFQGQLFRVSNPWRRRRKQWQRLAESPCPNEQHGALLASQAR
jgi:hypothetical protein